jgi:hypothetical protein
MERINLSNSDSLGMENADFVNSHEKDQRTGNNVLIHADDRKKIPPSGKFLRYCKRT